MNKYLERFAKQGEKMLKQLHNGEITEAEYRKWYQNRVFAGKQWQARLNTLADDYTHANQLAMNAINGALPEVYANNFNYAAYLTEQQARADLSFQLVDRWTVERLVKENPQLLPAPRVDIPKDKRWNRQKIMSAVTQGIIQGESIQKIARRLKKVTDMNSASAIRNARTAVTGAECAGRYASYRAAKEKGIDLSVEWMATLDNRTRHTHAILDGQRKDVDEPFIVDGVSILFPGDAGAKAIKANDKYKVGSVIYNCRCTIVARVKGYEHYHQTRWIENGKEQRGAGIKYGTGKLGDESYDEWKARHKAAIKK
ncbi:MAG: phage head morphogenesis protein [Oscillospiraceae bacterium]|nr:phage head morphogenesis protein [Oscillospiraceae bacterium]